MDKLKLHTPDFTEENIAKLAELFPSCLTEAKNENGGVKKAVDFEQLRQELSTFVVDGTRERYHLDWPGKREALLTANAPIAKTLRPCREESVNFDKTENLFIEGDNLDVLKMLQESYLNMVKMIYIDPPYNTGNDFIYNDDFSENTESYFQRSNQKTDTGNRLIANTESNGRFHSDWMSMIYPRLKLARNLLKENGVIFLSIDDGEIMNVRRICDEIFGEENFIDNIIWKKRYGGGAKEKYLVSLHEYVLVYAKNKLSLDNFSIPLTEESIKRYYKQKDTNFAMRGPYRTHPLEATKSMGERKNLVFPISGPSGIEIMPKRQWLWGKERVEKALANGELEFLKDKNGGYSVHTKQYLKDEKGHIRKGKPFSLIDDIYTQHGTNEIIDLFGNAQIFSFPKPSLFIKRLIDVGTDGEEEEIVLDFFAGSCASGHALFMANATDNGKRKYIAVQIPEACDENSEAFKAGFKAITEIGKERIRRAGKKVKEENSEKEGVEQLDIGFRVLKMDSSNMNDVYYTPDALNHGDLFSQADNIREDRTPEDLLFQVLLDWGVDLTLSINKETIADKTVFFVDGSDKNMALAACFDTGITEDFVKELATRKPLRVVFRDSGFENDSVKINVEQIFKLMSPSTDVKVI